MENFLARGGHTGKKESQIAKTVHAEALLEIFGGEKLKPASRCVACNTSTGWLGVECK
jgi:hypothetical protein